MSDVAEETALKRLGVDILPALNALCRKFHVRSLVLFGSANTDAFDPDQSDIDLIAEYEELHGPDRVNAYFGFKDALEHLFGRSVDLLTKQPIRNPYLRRSIESNHRQIFPQP